MSRRATSAAERAAATVASEEVLAFMARKRTARKRATRKLEGVAERLIAAQPPLDRARDLWVHGSYARGAPDVGDIDLLLRVDEHKRSSQQALDAFYRRAHPYAEIVKALGCGGGSIVNLDVEPVFTPAPSPISPERAPTPLPADVEIPNQPLLAHVVTGDPFDPQPQLLWVRGDSLADVRARLARLPEDAHARRFERTTTAPLMDTLLPLLGVQIGFLLAAHIRAGNIDAAALVLPERPPPRAATASLARRYRPDSQRYRAAAAALSHLKMAGVDLDHVLLVDAPMTRSGVTPQVSVDFNAGFLYHFAASAYDDGWRHFQVWPAPRENQWLALELRVNDGEAVHRLYWLINHGEAGSRHERIRRELDMPALDA
jgi:hypothetical protein